MLPTGFPCLLFHNDLLQDFVSYIFLNPKIKKVDALGRISDALIINLNRDIF